MRLLRHKIGPRNDAEELFPHPSNDSPESGSRTPMEYGLSSRDMSGGNFCQQAFFFRQPRPDRQESFPFADKPCFRFDLPLFLFAQKGT